MSGIFRPLRADEIECRVQSVKQNGLILLLYKDARCDQNILDETVGPMNWQRSHSRDNANCTVSIWDKEKQQWISKEDTGTESNTEAQKGLASDSFKRACFNWGIGRELYSAPFTWVSSSNCTIKTKNTPKGVVYFCNDRFSVKEIEYKDGNISKLVILNNNTNRECFRYEDRPAPKQGEKAPQRVEPQQYEQKYTCERCTLPIHSVPGRGGKELSPVQIVAESKKRFNAIYCADCMKRMMEAQKQREQAGN
jgi:hypothetical protein